MLTSPVPSVGASRPRTVTIKMISIKVPLVTSMNRGVDRKMILIPLM